MVLRKSVLMSRATWLSNRVAFTTAGSITATIGPVEEVLDVELDELCVESDEVCDDELKDESVELLDEDDELRTDESRILLMTIVENSTWVKSVIKLWERVVGRKVA